MKMPRGFYGAKPQAIRTINDLLGLPASGQEQDWEIELADPARIDEMLDLQSLHELDYDAKCALSLLLIGSIELAFENGALEEHQVRRASEFFRENPPILEAMCCYWNDLRMAGDSSLMKRILSL